MIEITRLTSSTGPLTKRISLSDDGALISDGSACMMWRGAARRVHLDGVAAFADLIEYLEPNQAIALGALRSDLPDEVKVTTDRDLTGLNGAAPPNLIARTADHIAYRKAEPALALIDVDTKGMPGAVCERIRLLGGYVPALISVLPGLAEVARVVRTSTSSGISRSDTEEPLKGSNGVHVFLLVQDGADIERFLRTLHDRCWLHGFGWMMVGGGGQLLQRSLIDRTVYAAERLVFEAPPILQAPLLQDPAQRAPEVIEGDAADTRSMCRDLNIAERAQLRDLKAVERHRLAGPADLARAKFVATQATRLVERTRCPPAEAQRTVLRQCAGTLLPGVELPFDAEELAGSTVASVLANPDRFVGATMADPLEGVGYGTCKAKVMQRSDGTLWIHSFAHGRTTYELKHDAAAVRAALNTAPKNEVASIFVRLAIGADLDPDDLEDLRDLAAARAGVGKRAIERNLKSALPRARPEQGARGSGPPRRRTH